MLKGVSKKEKFSSRKLLSAKRRSRAFFSGADLRAENAPKRLDDDVPVDPRKKLVLLPCLKTDSTLLCGKSKTAVHKSSKCMPLHFSSSFILILILKLFAIEICFSGFFGAETLRQDKLREGLVTLGVRG